MELQETYLDTTNWDFAKKGIRIKKEKDFCFEKRIFKDKYGVYTKSSLEDESFVNGLKEYSYLIREVWYTRQGSANQNTQLHEVEAEYSDGDLHHYFELKSTNEDNLVRINKLFIITISKVYMRFIIVYYSYRKIVLYILKFI